MFLGRHVASVSCLPKDAFIAQQLKKPVLSDFPSVLCQDLGEFSNQHAAGGDFHALSKFRVGCVLFYLGFKSFSFVLLIFERLKYLDGVVVCDIIVLYKESSP